jgi:hypothetical protein
MLSAAYTSKTIVDREPVSLSLLTRARINGLVIDFEDISTFFSRRRLAGHCRPAKANKSF